MASDDDGEKYGRTMWDVIAIAVKSRMALAVLTILIVIAIILAAQERLRLGYGKDGWNFCFPCEGAPESKIAAGDPASSGSATVPATEASSARGVERAPGRPNKLFASVLTLPVFSTLEEAKAILPESAIRKDGSISYKQDFLGYPMHITERFNGSTYTQELQLWFHVFREEVVINSNLNTSGLAFTEVNSYCFNEKYSQFVRQFISLFGDVYFEEANKIDVTNTVEPSEQILSFIGDCTAAKNSQCTKFAEQTKRVIKMKNDTGLFILTVTLTNSIRTFDKKTIYHYIDCSWDGVFQPAIPQRPAAIKPLGQRVGADRGVTSQ